MNTMHLIPLNYINCNNKTKRTCMIKRFSGDEFVNEQELWFEFENIEKRPEDKDCESYLIVMIMEAMKENRNVIVHGNVSRELLSNLVEYQCVWNKWLPEIYNRVNIEVEEIIENPLKVSGALCAFSGGVDATFTVYRNSKNKNSYRSQKINLCSIIHGFDIPLVDKKAFNNVLNQA